MHRYGTTLLIASLVGCTAGTPTIYAGQLEPVSGTCDAPLRAELTLHNHAVLFTPSSGTLVLTGQQTDNDVTAQNTLITPEHKTYGLKFDGHVNDHAIEGTYTTPRCRYRVHLTPTSQ